MKKIIFLALMTITANAMAFQAVGGAKQSRSVTEENCSNLSSSFQMEVEEDAKIDAERRAEAICRGAARRTSNFIIKSTCTRTGPFYSITNFFSRAEGQFECVGNRH